MVDGVVGVVCAGEDQLRDGDEGVPLLEQGLQDAGQGLRRVDGRVVEQDNGAGLHLGGDPLGDLRRGELLPVQAVTVPHSFKPLSLLAPQVLTLWWALRLTCTSRKRIKLQVG